MNPPLSHCLSLCLCLCLWGTALPSQAQSQPQPQQDRSAERAARRQQQQMQALQQQVTQAEADKAKLEQERSAIAKQLQDRTQASARAGAAQRAVSERVKALEAEKEQLTLRVAELLAAADVQRRQAEQAVALKDGELLQAAQAGKVQAAERDQWQQRFGEQARLVVECSNKNDRLVRISAELLGRWQSKGFVDVLRQREPVLGFNDVQIFNLVQEYRDKTDSERFTPRVERN